jgi:hypothetical protein
LRRKNPGVWSWTKITKKLDPQGYAENAQQAKDRMRMGIQAWQKREARQNKP